MSLKFSGFDQLSEACTQSISWTIETKKGDNSWMTVFNAAHWIELMHSGEYNAQSNDAAMELMDYGFSYEKLSKMPWVGQEEVYTIVDDNDNMWLSINYSQYNFTHVLKPRYRTDANQIGATFRATIFGNGKPVA
jgi:hypothetical protein